MSTIEEKIEVKQLIAKDFFVAEAIKTLRTNLLFGAAKAQTVALTSFSDTEGKSTIAFQLAASLANAGKRVLLLDTDLRRSVLAQRLQVSGDVEGLSHYLAGLANANDLIHETDVSGLYIMFSGPHVPNSSELLGGDGFVKLIAALKKVFDYVILDAPPLGQIVDCAVMAPALDGVLIVIDVNHNSKKLLRRIKEQLERTGAKILGVVLNRVDIKDKGGYYGRIYNYQSYHHDEQ